MKIYPKKFENIFQVDRKNNYSFPGKRVKKDGTVVYGSKLYDEEFREISFDSLETEEGIERVKTVMDEWNKKEFDHLVKLLWLVARMWYGGSKIKEFVSPRSVPFHLFKNNDPHHRVSLKLAIKELNHKLGRELFPFKNFNKFELAVSSYIYHFFPRDEFLSHDPFLEPELYAFPFEHVDLEFLTFVYQLDERFEILKMAEDEKWSLDYFRDWVVNYISSFNLEYGENVFVLVMDEPGHRVPFIRDKRFVIHTGLSARVINEKLEKYCELKKEEEERFGDMVKFKTFQECFPKKYE